MPFASPLSGAPATDGSAAGLLPVLALDTSTETLVAAVHDGRRAWCCEEPGGAAASTRLLPLLRALLDYAGLAWADVQAIAFGRGPGAFTGLRTACAVAQGLAFGLARPVLPLDSLLIVAEQARGALGTSRSGPVDVAVAQDARMDEVYAARYRWQHGAWQVLQPPLLAAPGALADAWQGLPPHHLVGSALAVMGDRLALPPTWPRPELLGERRDQALARLAVAAARQGPGLDAAEALPLYLRDKVALTTHERAARASA